MKTEEKTALLGFHDTDYFGMFGPRFDRKGYSVETVTNIDQMMECARKKEYDVYVMDANLGSPESIDVSSSRRVYESVKGRVDNGNAEFYAVAGLPTTVEKAIDEGIPAMSKSELIRKLESEFQD